VLRRVARRSGRGDLWSGREPMVPRWRFDTQGQEDGGGGRMAGSRTSPSLRKKGCGTGAWQRCAGDCRDEKGAVAKCGTLSAGDGSRCGRCRHRAEQSARLSDPMPVSVSADDRGRQVDLKRGVRSSVRSRMAGRRIAGAVGARPGRPRSGGAAKWRFQRSMPVTRDGISSRTGQCRRESVVTSGLHFNPTMRCVSVARINL
jgi:hypothetical protein